MKTTVILGAGFSKNSNIPVMSEIPKMLVEDVSSEFDKRLSNIVKAFLKDVFGTQEGKEIPALDDILTCIDISTNSGHHLGISYSPIYLRAIRRILVYKIFKLLEEPFILSEDVKALIGSFLGEMNTSFIVLNWDCVLEKYLQCISEDLRIDYCNGGLNLGAKESFERTKVKVLKLHGSCNWLYCDNCRSLFEDLENRIPAIRRSGIKKDDLDLFKEIDGMNFRDIKDINCSICGNSISSHIATFSYRKSFRTNSFAAIWSEAEKELSGSDRWIFIGYSLPEADYEFKHLLKISELKLQHLKRNKLLVDLILFNSKSTINKYEGFFGNRLEGIYNRGIRDYLNHLHHI